ncbi:MAG: VWA domain-containing protein [Chlorobia bacterium]|nr:VWA domain-containing protein [Fimbriimonadaceae bacterium]
MQTQTIGAVGMLTITLLAATMLSSRQAPAQASNEPAPGQLTIIQKDGKAGSLCPLERTSVTADVSGFGARVTVTQTFQNPTNEPIEAIYTFPLPNDASVDRMQMQLGTRLVEAEIKRREDARRIYDEAKNAGQSAALLDQERPNVFTQSVANIMPGSKVKIIISYVQILKFEEGQFEFNFPMVVGPRYTANAPDPAKISPTIVHNGTRSGASIDLTINLDAGAPIQEFNSVLHKVNVNRRGQEAAKITLARGDEIPNKDFILRYRTSTDTVQDAFITHMGQKGGFFTLILMPPKTPRQTQIAPREVVFVMDQSGSQSGFPIEKSKELTLSLIKTLRPGDTFNVMGFNTQVRMLWPAAKPNTAKNIAEAEAFVKGMQANGGTHIREGAVAALAGQNDPDRLRMVIFNTDGYVGDEALILDTIQKNRDRARMFTFGIGNSVNRYLIDQMAFEGKGDVEYVTLAEAADGAVKRFIDRTRSPILTDVSASFEGVDIQDALPRAIPDVFSENPVIITGRYSNPGKGKLTLKGELGGQPWSKTIDLDFPANAHAPALESLWARQRVDELTRRNHLAAAYPESSKVSNEDIIQVALEFGIMTQLTSFVAVEKKVINIGGKQRTVAVPVEMADGVSYEGIFGKDKQMNLAYGGRSSSRLASPGASGGFGGGGFGGGGGSTGTTGTTGTTGGGNIPVSNGVPVRRLKSLGDGLESKAEDATIVRQDDSKMKPEERRLYRYETRVPKALRDAKGSVEIEVWFKKLDKAVLAKMTKLGLKVDFFDEKLRVAMGTCDAKILIELAQVDEVDKIKKL